MNLAMKDLRRQKVSFSATALGLGLLFAIVLAMGGIYRGLVEDATLLVDHLGADIWVVQRDTRGPFAERSTVPPALEDRLRAQAGVASARSFSTATIQRIVGARSLRMTVVGLSWPEDKGQALPLVSGRHLRDPHREVIAYAAAAEHHRRALSHSGRHPWTGDPAITESFRLLRCALQNLGFHPIL